MLKINMARHIIYLYDARRRGVHAVAQQGPCDAPAKQAAGLEIDPLARPVGRTAHGQRGGLGVGGFGRLCLHGWWWRMLLSAEG